jgi:hypothetical protein
MAPKRAAGYNPAMRSAPSREEAVLAALAAGVLGPAFDPAVPGRMLAILGRLASRGDRERLGGVLRALDTRAGALALTGRPGPVSARPPAATEALVRRWAGSRLPLRRRLADALAPVALLAAYGWPGPARDATGYPGPLGPAPDVPRRLRPLVLAADDELACDVVVVGSGAGGGVAAAELARAGLDVVVLEKGGHAAERDFSHTEGDAYRQLYLYGLTLTTDDLACRIVAGSTLGGGTVVNYTTSFPTPPEVLAEWAEVSGVEAFVSGEVAASLEAVAARLGVTEAESRPGARDQLLERGLERLGWHAGRLPRNVRGCAQDAGCGWCGFGCRLGAKQSTLVTYLEEAAAAGARLVVEADAAGSWSSPPAAAGPAGPPGSRPARAAGTGWWCGPGRWWPPPERSRPRPCCSAPGWAARSAATCACTRARPPWASSPSRSGSGRGPCRPATRPSCAAALARTRRSSRRCPCTRARPRPLCRGGRPPTTGP